MTVLRTFEILICTLGLTSKLHFNLIRLQALRNTKVWFVDATFKPVKKPYYQLWRIHSYIKSGEATKQMPMCFILMSRRQAVDYEMVFRKLLEVTGSTFIHISSIILPFLFVVFFSIMVFSNHVYYIGIVCMKYPYWYHINLL